MEDLKIYFHGRPQGQNIWGVGNGDNAGIYLGQCLNWSYGKGMTGCMVIDHWNGDTFYSYIHRTNVFEKEGRDNAYCAITLRLQQKECHNVSTLYELLESAYSQLANIAVKTTDNGTGQSETFLISTFSEIQESLSDISKKVILNIESLDKLKNSIYPLQGAATTSDQAIRYSLEEVDSPAFRKDVVQNRILISKDIKTKAAQLSTRLSELEEDKNTLKNKLQNANNQYNAAMVKVKEKEEELKKAKEENAHLRNEKKEREKNAYGMKTSQRHEKPVHQNEEGASPNFAAGFQKGFKNGTKNDNQYKLNGSSAIIPEVWYRGIVLASLFLLVACSIVILGKMSNQTSSNTNEQDAIQTDTTDNDTMDTPDVDDVKTYQIQISPNPQNDVLTVKEEYTLTLSDDDSECLWYYQYSGKQKESLGNNIITPKSYSSAIAIIAEIDGKEVARKIFKTNDAPKPANITGEKGGDTQKKAKPNKEKENKGQGENPTNQDRTISDAPTDPPCTQVDKSKRPRK